MTRNSPIELQENFDRLVRQEELILEVTEKLALALDEAGITRTELAGRLGRTPGYVSQVFAGGRKFDAPDRRRYCGRAVDAADLDVKSPV